MRISDWSSDVCSSDLAFVLTFSPGRERIFILPLQHAVQPHRGLGEHVICKLRGAGGSDEPCLHADGIKSIKNGLPDGAIGGAIIGLLHRFGAIFRQEGEMKQICRLVRSEERRVGKKGVSTWRSGWL